ncbi:hypothetical protein DYB31_000191 [Aphanomyces astaci]|uniref:Uncharacterized protein n=1 Tax=Aphanomyces astaci TaxID=112090 RepID=A0A397FI65_APHAT|nr:hypothetical protein DYB31_000191 [Aphanomyces astaci]
MLRQSLLRPSRWRVHHRAQPFSNVTIGGITAPQGQVKETLAHLRWMLQKDILHQDMFLIGYAKPGSHTSRREILGGSAIFADQAPVRAAIHGRILILDGTLHHPFMFIHAKKIFI